MTKLHLSVSPPVAVTGLAVNERLAPAIHAAQAERNQALDFTKGALVLVMVFYHWLNYFVGLQLEIYRYLRFLTPSFILITGFIVSSVYLRKRNNDAALYRRLWVRGAKLLLLFTALNVAVSAATTQNYNGAPLGLTAFTSNLYGVYVRGDGRAAFDILVPIAYFLLFLPAILAMTRRWSPTPVALAAIGLTLSFVAGRDGAIGPNVELLSFAMLGMAIGTLPLGFIERAGRQPTFVFLAYVLYLAALTVWNVVLPVQVAGVCLSLLVLYLVGDGWGEESRMKRHVIELGKYSLLAYIGQVVVLQVLRRGLQNFTLTGVELAIPLALTFALTGAAVELTAATRRRVPVFDRVYRAVFA